jgi:prophage DNA circulation protein
MGRADKLLKASFRGVEFAYLDASSDHGRRGQLHEYPGSDDSYFEDLGLKTRQYTLDVFVLGDDWQAQTKSLLAAFEARGPGILVHPVDGRLQVNCLSAKRSETVTALGKADFTVTFVPTGSASGSGASTDTGGASDNAAANARTRSQSAFAKGFALLGQPPSVQFASLGALGQALGTVQDAVGFANGVIAGAAGWVNFAETAAGTVKNVVSEAIGAPGALGALALSAATIFDPQRAVAFVADITATRNAGSLLANYPALPAQLGGSSPRFRGST